jgi:hypothetical protein
MEEIGAVSLSPNKKTAASSSSKVLYRRSAGAAAAAVPPVRSLLAASTWCAPTARTMDLATARRALSDLRELHAAGLLDDAAYEAAQAGVAAKLTGVQPPSQLQDQPARPAGRGVVEAEQSCGKPRPERGTRQGKRRADRHRRAPEPEPEPEAAPPPPPQPFNPRAWEVGLGLGPDPADAPPPPDDSPPPSSDEGGQLVARRSAVGGVGAGAGGGGEAQSRVQLQVNAEVAAQVEEEWDATGRALLRRRLETFLESAGIGGSAQRRFDPTPLLEFAKQNQLFDAEPEEIYGRWVDTKVAAAEASMDLTALNGHAAPAAEPDGPPSVAMGPNHPCAPLACAGLSHTGCLLEASSCRDSCSVLFAASTGAVGDHAIAQSTSVGEYQSITNHGRPCDLHPQPQTLGGRRGLHDVHRLRQ